MENIHKLPFISGFSAAIIAGIASYAAGAGDETIYLRMAVMMLVFFILGVYARNTITNIKIEIQIRKARDEMEEEQRLKIMKEEQKAAALAAKFQPAQKAKPPEPKIELAADGNEEFEPLTVSRAIRTKAKE